MKMDNFSKNDQSGMVSIMVVGVIIVLLSLVTIGFTKLMGRELRQSLDNQLNLQAYYAAESGVNDAARVAASFNTCAGSVPAMKNFKADSTAKYTCVSANPDTGNLKFGNTPEGSYQAIEAIFNGGGPNIPVSVTWQPPQGQTGGVPSTPYNKLFPPRAAWGSASAVLRVAVYKNIDRLSSERDTIISGAQVFFLKPDRNSFADDVPLIHAACNPECSATFNLPSSFAGSNALLVISTIYNGTEGIEVSTPGGIAGQLEVDSTGKANDVVRRISARVPLKSALPTGLPLSAITSIESICKRWRIPVDGSAVNQPLDCS